MPWEVYPQVIKIDKKLVSEKQWPLLAPIAADFFHKETRQKIEEANRNKNIFR